MATRKRALCRFPKRGWLFPLLARKSRAGVALGESAVRGEAISKLASYAASFRGEAKRPRARIHTPQSVVMDSGLAASRRPGMTELIGTPGPVKHRCPFIAAGLLPYFGDGEPTGQAAAKAQTRSREAFLEGPGKAHARKGLATGSAADRAGTCRIAQSRNRARNGWARLADRIAAAAGQFL